MRAVGFDGDSYLMLKVNMKTSLHEAPIPRASKVLSTFLDKSKILDAFNLYSLHSKH
jgi:hypothetical protein